MTSLTDAIRRLEHGDWHGAHLIVQDDSSRLACWAHGIVHLMEGDLDNAEYWYRRAERGRATPHQIAAEIAALKGALDACQRAAPPEPPA